jgi:hypothetical protein
MLDMGFMSEVESMVRHVTMPVKSERQTLMFSATFPEEIQRAAARYLPWIHFFHPPKVLNLGFIFFIRRKVLTLDSFLLFFGQQPLELFLLLGPPFFPIILFMSNALLTGVTGISLHLQWPLTLALDLPHSTVGLARATSILCSGLMVRGPQRGLIYIYILTPLVTLVAVQIIIRNGL